MNASAGAHVFLGEVVPLEQAGRASGLEWLSPGERNRLAGLSLPRRRSQFIAGRWAARQLLASLHGNDDPAAWSLSAPKDGPPVATHPAHAPACIGISHSGGHVACAASSEPVGIDIEATAVRERDILALALAAGTSAEYAELLTLVGSARHERFYAMWVLKEAWLKRRGDVMTPGTMARLETRRADDASRADALVWAVGAVLLAVVAGRGAAVHWAGSVPAAVPMHWRVRPMPDAS